MPPPGVKEPMPKYLDTLQRWNLFIRAYLDNGLVNPTKVYQETFNTKPKSASVQASLLLRNPKFQDHFAKALKEYLGNEKQSLEYRVVRTWVTRAFYETSDILDERGNLVKSMAQLKAEGLSCVIDGIDKAIDRDGGEHVIYRLADRNKALKMLADYTKIIQAPEVNVSITNNEAKIYVIQRRTVEEWQTYYQQMQSGTPSLDKPSPSLPPPSSSSSEAPRVEGRAITSSPITPTITRSGVKRGVGSFSAANTRSSKS